MPKPFMSNNDIILMIQLSTSTGLFMSTLVISITNVEEIKTEKHIMYKQSTEQCVEYVGKINKEYVLQLSIRVAVINKNMTYEYV